MEWVQCDKCEGWYHVVCVGISAQDASKIDEYVCPYCVDETKSSIKPEPMEVDRPLISDLSVMAEVAHQIITDQEKNLSSVVGNSVDAPIPTNVSSDLNSLICLADVSEKMDPNKIGTESATPQNMDSQQSSSNLKER